MKNENFVDIENYEALFKEFKKYENVNVTDKKKNFIDVLKKWTVAKENFCRDNISDIEKLKRYTNLIDQNDINNNYIAYLLERGSVPFGYSKPGSNFQIMVGKNANNGFYTISSNGRKIDDGEASAEEAANSKQFQDVIMLFNIIFNLTKQNDIKTALDNLAKNDLYKKYVAKQLIHKAVVLETCLYDKKNNPNLEFEVAFPLIFIYKNQKIQNALNLLNLKNSGNFFEISNSIVCKLRDIINYFGNKSDKNWKTVKLTPVTIDIFSDILWNWNYDHVYAARTACNNDHSGGEITLSSDSNSHDLSNESFSMNDFLCSVFISEEQYVEIVEVLKYKKNVILQGCPGVGKTWMAERLAWSIIGKKSESQVQIVQFHQNYSYEDFIIGYKPNENGFKLQEGQFFNFCKTAQNSPDEKFFFIIDEINRGNISKIFGEILMLIENDYRGKTISLSYNGLPFCIPDNIYIMGMMNTADRSLAMIDYALRRRFAFFDINPCFGWIQSDIHPCPEINHNFRLYIDSLMFTPLIDLIELIRSLNLEIINTLGKGFCIGHSYFCNLTKETCTKERLYSIIKYEILPMLREYWFDEESRVITWENNFKSWFDQL